MKRDNTLLVLLGVGVVLWLASRREGGLTYAISKPRALITPTSTGKPKTFQEQLFRARAQLPYVSGEWGSGGASGTF
jgi:hypothetical protein